MPTWGLHVAAVAHSVVRPRQPGPDPAREGHTAHAVPSRPSPPQARQASRRPGLRLPSSAAMAVAARNPAPHRPQGRRELAAARPTSLDDRTDHVLAHRLPSDSTDATSARPSTSPTKSIPCVPLDISETDQCRSAFGGSVGYQPEGPAHMGAEARAAPNTIRACGSDRIRGGRL